MKNNLRNTLFGFRTREAAESFAALKAATPAPAFNEAGTTLSRQRVRRVIGITEQRLRARNQPSWLANTWRKFFARITLRRATVGG